MDKIENVTIAELEDKLAKVTDHFVRAEFALKSLTEELEYLEFISDTKIIQMVRDMLSSEYAELERLFENKKNEIIKGE